VEKFIPPKKGPAHVWRLIKEIFTYQPRDLRTSIGTALDYLNSAVRRHAIVFLISDCHDSGYGKSLQLTAKKHDLTVIRINDPAEEEIPAVGLITLRDPETGEIAVVDTGDRKVREAWRRYRREEAASLNDMTRRAGVDLVELTTGGSVVEPLTRLFEMRKRH
jgi:uncharacterized protein (DUF58 family)